MFFILQFKVGRNLEDIKLRLTPKNINDRKMLPDSDAEDTLYIFA
jgi:hypothetical protein